MDNSRPRNTPLLHLLRWLALSPFAGTFPPRPCSLAGERAARTNFSCALTSATSSPSALRFSIASPGRSSRCRMRRSLGRLCSRTCSTSVEASSVKALSQAAPLRRLLNFSGRPDAKASTSFCLKSLSSCPRGVNLGVSRYIGWGSGGPTQVYAGVGQQTKAARRARRSGSGARPIRRGTGTGPCRRSSRVPGRSASGRPSPRGSPCPSGLPGG